MADAFNPNSFSVPRVQSGAERVNEMGGMQRKERGVGKDMMSQLSQPCVCVSVCSVCLVHRAFPSLMAPVIRAG